MGIINFFKETKTEMTHVAWPKSKQAFLYTLFIIVFCVVVAALLGLFDYVFSFFIKSII